MSFVFSTTVINDLKALLLNQYQIDATNANETDMRKLIEAAFAYNLQALETGIKNTEKIYNIDTLEGEALKSLCNTVGAQYIEGSDSVARQLLKGLMAVRNSNGQALDVLQALRLITGDNEAQTVDVYPAAVLGIIDVDFTYLASILTSYMNEALPAGVEWVGAIYSAPGIFIFDESSMVDIGSPGDELAPIFI